MDEYINNPRTNQPPIIWVDLIHPDDVHGEFSRYMAFDDDQAYIRIDIVQKLCDDRRLNIIDQLEDRFKDRRFKHRNRDGYEWDDDALDQLIQDLRPLDGCNELDRAVSAIEELRERLERRSEIEP
jgi:hypothetical protein